MAGRYPKAQAHDARPERSLGWIELPVSRDEPAPALPDWKIWHPKTLEWWTKLWTKPQASQWDQSGESLHPLAMIYDDIISQRTAIEKVSAELRQHEDRHGLNPKAMMQMRWRVPRGTAEIDKSLIPSAAAAPASDDRRQRLKVVG